MKITIAMEAENPRIIASASAANTLAGREVVFTPDQARRAQPYMARIAADAATAYREAQRCREALGHAASPRDARLITERRDLALERLNAVIDEANAVGADLLDIPRGLIRFHGVHDGRRVRWHWALGENVSDRWPLESMNRPCADGYGSAAAQIATA